MTIAERQAAVSFLEFRQKQIFGSSKLTTSVEDLDKTCQAICERFPSLSGWDPEELRVICREYPPSRYQDLADYGILLKLYKTLVVLVAKAGWETPALPVVGTIPLQSMNACAERVPGTSDHVVWIQSGTFFFLNLIAKVVGLALPVVDSSAGKVVSLNSLDEHLCTHPEIQIRFDDAADAFLIAGEPGHALPYVEPIPETNIVESILESAEMFVLAHEFGHILGGHIPESGPPIPNPAQEFEADGVALKLVLADLDRETHPVQLVMRFWGVEVFFRMAHFVSEAAAVLAHDEQHVKIVDSHPPALDRLRRLRSTFVEIYPGASQSLTVVGEFLERLFIYLGASTINRYRARDRYCVSMRYWSRLGATVDSQLPLYTLARQFEQLEDADPNVRLFYLRECERFSLEIVTSLFMNIGNENEAVDAFCRKWLSWMDEALSSRFSQIHQLVADNDLMALGHCEAFMRELLDTNEAFLERLRLVRNIATKGRAEGTISSDVDDEETFQRLYQAGTILLNLRSKNRDLRRLSAETLKQMNPRTFILAFLARLLHPNDSVRELAEAILTEINPDTAKLLDRLRCGVNQVDDPALVEYCTSSANGLIAKISKAATS